MGTWQHGGLHLHAHQNSKKKTAKYVIFASPSMSLPTPNNTIIIIIILEHCPSYRKRSKELWIYIYCWVRMDEGTHFWPTFVFLWQKRYHTLGLNIWFALKKLCSRLLCASGSFGAAQPGECREGCLFSLSLCQFLLVKIEMVEKKSKSNVASRKMFRIGNGVFEMVKNAALKEQRCVKDRFSEIIIQQ